MSKIKRPRPTPRKVAVGFTLENVSPAAWAALKQNGIGTADLLRRHLERTSMVMVERMAEDGAEILAKQAAEEEAVAKRIAALEAEIAAARQGKTTGVFIPGVDQEEDEGAAPEVHRGATVPGKGSTT
ncbi:MAG: hypothetical protein GY719_26105 [bacterium]|nr:hypothetical protein [bacterium]